MGYRRWRFISEKIPEELLCPMCENVLHNPIQCKRCRNYYCESCLADRENFPEDPNICDHPEIDQTAVNKYLQRKINDMQIVCKFKPYGCTWEGKVGQVDSHEYSCTCRPTKKTSAKVTQAKTARLEARKSLNDLLEVQKSQINLSEPRKDDYQNLLIQALSIASRPEEKQTHIGQFRADSKLRMQQFVGTLQRNVEAMTASMEKGIERKVYRGNKGENEPKNEGDATSSTVVENSAS